jgi:uncharacterized protein (TIGR02466 family)
MNFIDLFPTTVAAQKLISLDVEAALERIKSLNYVDDSGNRGQYTQDQNLLADPYFVDVCEEIEAACSSFAKAHGHQVEGVGICSSWANRIPSGNIINRHTHANSYISGTFYLTGGSPIEFFNTGLNDTVFNFAPEKRFDANNVRTFGSVYFDVEPGQLLLFPSSLAHGVQENKGADRYSVAFNTLPVGLFGEPTKQMRWSKQG